MIDDHLQHAGGVEIPQGVHPPHDVVIVRPAHVQAPSDHRLPVVREEMFRQLALMAVGACVEVNRSADMMKNYCFRFRAETGRRDWRFRIRQMAAPNWSRVWRVNDEPAGEPA